MGGVTSTVRQRNTERGTLTRGKYRSEREDVAKSMREVCVREVLMHRDWLRREDMSRWCVSEEVNTSCRKTPQKKKKSLLVGFVLVSSSSLGSVF